jgi:hypothetical protein
MNTLSVFRYDGFSVSFLAINETARLPGGLRRTG